MIRVTSRNFSQLSLNPSFPVLFPGQGSQFLGMASILCEEYPVAKHMFSQASEILNVDLLKLCSEGPKSILDSTKFSQPAIYVASVAAMEVYKNHIVDHCIHINPPTVALGLSLGEYSALCYSGVFSFEDGLWLTKVRGEEMQKACDISPGSMVAVAGLDLNILIEKCEEACKISNKFVHIGNYLAPQQYVISGDTAAVESIMSSVDKDVKTTRLAVSGAFHSRLMQPAQNVLQNAIESIKFSLPEIPIVMNVNGDAICKECGDQNTVIEKIKSNLIEQLTHPVQWEKSLRTVLSAGNYNSNLTANTAFAVDKRFKMAYEVGPGNSCSATLKRVHRRAKVISFDCN